ncbi:MAG: response regulator transcription factor [Acidobacteriia bacterium]|nr:response regulator transcription factor [Terriglobia bacterium]
MNRLLIVEDEKHLADGLRFNLESQGYAVEAVETGEAALDLVIGKSERFDVVILDIMLPGIDGFTVVSEMRRASKYVPTLILTARGQPDDVLQGFAAGADDYLAKPFELAILIARVRSLVRRREWLHASLGTPGTQHPGTFAFDDTVVHFDRLQIQVRNQVFPLTLMESNLLRCLIRHKGEAVSRKVMLEEVWELHEDTDTRAIDNFVVRLRRYIERDPRRPRHLLTVRGVGYRFVASAVERS